MLAAALTLACGAAPEPAATNVPAQPSPPPSPTPPPVPPTPVAPAPPTPAPDPACATDAPTAVFHRLNRTEYHNSVNALLGTNLPLRDRLPPDPLLYGFDNNADTALGAPLVQRYLDAARTAVATALQEPRSRTQLVPCDPADPACAHQVFARFLPRAFRRPVTAAEIDEHVGYRTICDGAPIDGVACGLEAALVSPHFLFRAELPASMLAPHALATRLAYFLWSSAPDDELLGLATTGRLGEPAVLAAQVERMLRPETQAAFVRPLASGLPAQWLGLDGLTSAAPSPVLFPGFDEELRAAMADEARLYFADVLQHDRSALELLRAPFTFVNARLAAHYGVPAITGTHLRKVDTSGTLRGGVLTQGAFLTATSSSENTSIVGRARWVLQNLLCTAIDDPPPGAEEMTPAPDPALGLTRRQSLERRTAQPPCNACHAILNPIGFGLDVFDGVGAARASERGRPIDTSGTLPSGAAFRDTGELLAALAEDPRFPVCLTRKLVTYALGRGLAGACDEAHVRALADAFARDGFRLRNHVVRIATSPLFRSPRRPAEAPP